MNNACIVGSLGKEADTCCPGIRISDPSELGVASARPDEFRMAVASRMSSNSANPVVFPVWSDSAWVALPAGAVAKAAAVEGLLTCRDPDVAALLLPTLLACADV